MSQLPSSIVKSEDQVIKLAASKLTGKTILLVGGSGFFGNWCARLLRELGAKVIVADLSEKSDFVTNIMMPEQLNHLVKSVKPWAVVNLAANIFGTQAEQRQINVDGLNNLTEAILRYSPEARFVGIGTCGEYGTTFGTPVSESFACEPLSPYGITKLEGCQNVLSLVESRGLWGNWIRPANVIGIGMDERFILKKILRAMQKGNQFLEVSSASAVRDYISIRDIASLVALLLSSNFVGQIFNGSSGLGTSIAELSKLSSHVTGQSLECLESDFQGISPDVETFIALNTKAVDGLNWSPSTDLANDISLIWESIINEKA